MTDGLDEEQEGGSDLPLPDDIDGPHGSSPSRPEDVGLGPHAHGEVGSEVTEQGREDADSAVGNPFGVEMALEEMLPMDQGPRS